MMSTSPPQPPSIQVAFAYADKLATVLSTVKEELGHLLDRGRAEHYFTKDMAREIYRLGLTVDDALEFYNTPAAINEQMASDDAARESLLLSFEFATGKEEVHLQRYTHEVALCSVSTRRMDTDIHWPGGRLCRECGHAFAEIALIPDDPDARPQLTVATGPNDSEDGPQ